MKRMRGGVVWRSVSLCVFLAGAVMAGESWPQFLGPTADGHAPARGLPTTWSETENVTWKTALPGEGWSSPVILGDQIWMTTAVEGGRSLRALAVSRSGGKLVHDVELFRVEAPGFKHALNSYASPTPVIEAGRVYVTFGTYGSACLETATGRVVWRNEELKLDHSNGPGSSPILYGDLFILHCDGTNVQYVAALEKGTGRVVWKVNRSGEVLPELNPELRKAYSTPIVIRLDGRDQLISPGAQYLYAYEPSTGKELWSLRYPGFSNVPRPIWGHGLLYVCTGFMRPELWAVKPGGSGRLPEERVVWKSARQVPQKPSPILIGERLYVVSDGGILTCYQARTGEEIWRERLEGEYSASPLYADGRLYWFSQEGVATVTEPEDSFRVVAKNRLDAGFMASAAAVDGALYLRTKTHLYRVERR